MVGLQGARVLLLDDSPDESLPMIQAFAKAGVPLLYYDGQPANFPNAAKKPRGIRLAILDMDLGEGGDDATKASTLVQKLSLILPPDNGPYGILIWTKHPELIERVKNYIFVHEWLPKPVFVARMTKSECRVGTGYSIPRITRKLKEQLDEPSPLDCLQAWEGSNFNAATTVTNTLAELSDVQAPDLAAYIMQWRQEVLRVLHATGKARAEQHLTVDNCLPSVFLTMNPLHSDRMDLLAEALSASVSSHSQSVFGASQPANAKRRAQINSMLHLAFNDLSTLEPGNVYRFGTRRPPWIPSLKSIVKDSVTGSGATAAANLATLMNASHLIAVEVSPVCDHAQKKLSVSRMIPGFLVPTANSTLVKRGDYLKFAGPFQIVSARPRISEGSYNMYLNARYAFSTKPTELRRLTACARIRPQLLADIQMWLSYQGARQGVMMLS